MSQCRKTKALIESRFGKKNAVNIHGKLVNVYGKAALEVSTLEIISDVNGNPRDKCGAGLNDRPHCGRWHAAVN